jgi:hyperosmotically inducible periplasmic protein
MLNSTHTQPRKTLVALSLAALALTLAACDRAEPERAPETTVGQKIDGAISEAERKAEEMKADASEAAAKARVEGAQMADTAGTAVKDAAITTEVNAKLAADKTLSVMRINVDTSAGRVKLEGEAPSGEARNRASALASSVDGVVAVDNRLSVRASG